MEIRNRNIKIVVEKSSEKINELVGEIKKEILSRPNGVWSSLDEEFYREYVIFDMIKALEKFVSEEIELSKIEFGISKKNNLEIYSEWNNGEYFLSTEVIYAGGYNIQKLHYRYLVKSNLPRVYSNEESKNYKKQIKVLTKKHEINHEIELRKERIETLKKEIEINKDLSEEEVIERLKEEGEWVVDNYVSDPDFFNEYHKNYETYLKWIDETNEYYIKRWRGHNVDYKRDIIKNIEENIGILVKKLNKLG